MRNMMISKKYLLGGAVLTAISFGFTFWALELKGKIFSSIADRQLTPDKNTLFILTVFFILQMITVVANITKDRWQRTLKIEALETAWSRFFPKKIPSTSVNQAGSFFQAVTGNVPRVAEIHFLTVNEILQALAIFTFFVHRVVQDEFYYILLIAPVLMLASAGAGNFRFQAYKRHKQASIQERSQLMGWLERFFRSSFEFISNTRLHSDTRRKRLAQSAIANTSLSLWRLERLVLGREAFAAALMDLPYIAAIVSILYFATTGKLSLEAAVVWLGIIDFLIRASNSLRNVFQLRVERLALEGSTQELLTSLAIEKVDTRNTAVPPKPLRLKLTDGTEVHLDSANGLYVITGGNGTGKSTLLKTLGGVHPIPASWSHTNLKEWQDYLHHAFVVIDNHTEVLNVHESIFNMIDNEIPKTTIQDRLVSHLGLKLGLAWFEDVIRLQKSWDERANRQLSSGEKIKVSFVRAICAINTQTKAIFCDESDVHFDPATQKRFLLSLQTLKKSFLVLWISHSQQSEQYNLSTRVNLIGYSKGSGRAHCFNATVTARVPGSGQETFWGEGCDKFAPVLSRVRLAYQNQHPNSNFLKNADFHVDCTVGNFKILDVESTGLAFAVALTNLSRIHHGAPPLIPIAASGRVAIDGGVEPVAHLAEKRLAAQIQSIPYFLDSRMIQAIADIPKVLEEWNRARVSSETKTNQLHGT
jgi:ABC-type lipoprotein export system ATPase subunit